MPPIVKMWKMKAPNSIITRKSSLTALSIRDRPISTTTHIGRSGAFFFSAVLWDPEASTHPKPKNNIYSASRRREGHCKEVPAFRWALPRGLKDANDRFWGYYNKIGYLSCASLDHDTEVTGRRLTNVI